MLLKFANNEPFATGAIAYRIPQQGADAARITIGVEIEENLTEAIIDTGAPYIVCSPWLARLINLDPDRVREKITMRIRGYKIEGVLYRLRLSLLADEGEPLAIEAPAFIPDSMQEFTEGFLPRSFIGLSACLESICFAIDPNRELFYFG